MSRRHQVWRLHAERDGVVVDTMAQCQSQFAARRINEAGHSRAAGWTAHKEHIAYDNVAAARKARDESHEIRRGLS